MKQPPFPVEGGDSVNYFDAHGYQTGYFVKWGPNGSAIIRKPAGGRVTREPQTLRPCNDRRMVNKRGFIEFSVVHIDGKQKVTRGS